MIFGGFSALEWLALAERELLLFAGCFFLLGALDELGVDLVWVWLKLSGRARTGRIDREAARGRALAGKAAILIPAWREVDVIGATVAHALAAWPQADIRLYIGCYRNDPATAEAVLRAARGDQRLRLVIHGRSGPTTKADCLNRLYGALEHDERRMRESFRMVVLHDAEDMVDPAALGLLDAALEQADFVQLPVRPEPQPESRWVAGHYCEEFAEAHAKALVVRDALAAGLPAAGVGCAFSRAILSRLASAHGANVPEMAEGPFSVESLTEDYELGLRINALGGRSRFLRLRGDDGRLVATRACFPAELAPAVRQKTRWVHGIAFQGWDRLGWSLHPVELWMRMRDRRGPLTAIVLAAAYLLLVIAAILWAAELAGLGHPWKPDPLVQTLVAVNFASFVLRAAMRFAFTSREYGFAEGARAVLRIPLANVIAIMAGRRALFAYLRTFGGAVPQWDKTDHAAHPALMARKGARLNNRARVRGQPVLVLVALLGGWIAVRAALWETPFAQTAMELPESLLAGDPARIRPVIGRASEGAAAKDWSASLSRFAPSAAGRLRPEIVPVASTLMPPRLSAAQNMLLAAGLSAMSLPPELASLPVKPQAEAAPYQPLSTALASSIGGRWSADGWFLLRRGTTTALTSGRGSYGGSQAGAVLRYNLAPLSAFRPMIYARASQALGRAKDSELAFGLSVRPLPQVPVRAAAELRMTRAGGQTLMRPAAYAVTELPPFDLPLGFTGEVYGQAGYVGGKFASAFADGQIRAERMLAEFGDAELTVGGGAWGGAQKGAARIDFGPSASLRLRLGDTISRVSMDWRFRVAGDAQPASGPALTISAGF